MWVLTLHKEWSPEKCCVCKRRRSFFWGEPGDKQIILFDTAEKAERYKATYNLNTAIEAKLLDDVVLEQILEEL